MNILLLASDFLPVWGGAGTYATELAKNIDPDIELHVLTPFRSHFGNLRIESNSYINKCLPENVHIHYLGKAKDTFIYNLAFQIACSRNIKHFIEKFGINIIHSQSSMPDLIINHNKLRIPTVITVHSTIDEQAKTIRALDKGFNQLELSEKMTLALSYFNDFVEGRYYNNKKHYITVSEWGKKNLVNNKGVNPNKIKVIKNGVDSERFKPENKSASYNYFLELSHIDEPKILFLSRMIESKGLTFMIKSLPSILERVEAHFIFAGPGKRPNINLPKKNYTYLGYIPHEICPYLYATSDIFVLPSLYENCPISILEAMASGCAIIASNVGGIPEIISHGKNGLLIHPANSEAIAYAITTLLEDKTLMRELKINARKTAVEKFRWSETISDTIGYYLELYNK